MDHMLDLAKVFCVQRNAKGAGLVFNLDLGHLVFLGHTQDPPQTVDVKSLLGTYVPQVWGPCFPSIQYCRQPHCPVHSCFGRGSEVRALEDSGAKSLTGSQAKPECRRQCYKRKTGCCLDGKSMEL